MGQLGLKLAQNCANLPTNWPSIEPSLCLWPKRAELNSLLRAEIETTSGRLLPIRCKNWTEHFWLPVSRYCVLIFTHATHFLRAQSVSFSGCRFLGHLQNSSRIPRNLERSKDQNSDHVQIRAKLAKFCKFGREFAQSRPTLHNPATHFAQKRHHDDNYWHSLTCGRRLPPGRPCKVHFSHFVPYEFAPIESESKPLASLHVCTGRPQLMGKKASHFAGLPSSLEASLTLTRASRPAERYN